MTSKPPHELPERDETKTREETRKDKTMKQYLTIGNVNFEVQKKHVEKGVGERMKQRTLWDCYDRPSATKEEIYRKWQSWAYQNNITLFGVRSYNCNVFTLEGAYITANDGNLYYIEITPCYHRAYIIG